MLQCWFIKKNGCRCSKKQKTLHLVFSVYVCSTHVRCVAIPLKVNLSHNDGEPDEPPTIQTDRDGKSTSIRDSVKEKPTIQTNGDKKTFERKMSSDAKNVMLAYSWSEESDPTGYWMSEKLDGVRSYFDGENFYSREGNMFYAPAWFKEGLPTDQHLDGELWLGRGQFQKCVSIIKNQNIQREEEWRDILYIVFDAPNIDKVYEERMEDIKTIVPIFGQENIESICFARMVPIQKCQSPDHLLRELNQVLDKGGEGIMLRSPRSKYEFKRSKTMLKVKTFLDEEAIVLDRVNGTGKHKDRMGNLKVRTPDGRCFSVGSGFTDTQRENPPEVNSIITYKYQELTDKLIPRFPTFVGERVDINWKKYCDNYKLPDAKVAIPANKKNLAFSRIM